MTRTSLVRAIAPPRASGWCETEVCCERRGSWIELTAALRDPPGPLIALARNRVLGGFAKIALAPDASRLHIRAEVPTDVAGTTLDRRLADTETGIAEADGAIVWRAAERMVGPPIAVAPEALTGVVDGAGWPRVAIRADGIVIDLGLRARGARAVVEAPSATGAVRVVAAVETFPAPAAETCGAALARFLLRAAAIVRLARPVVVERGPWATAAFEVVYATAPDGAELGHALSALRIAVAMTRREVAVLARDPALARAYLHDGATTLADSGSATTASLGLGKGEA